MTASGAGARHPRLDPLAWLRGLADCLEKTTCEHRGRPVPLEAGLEALVRIWSRRRADGARVYWMGNGGSAAVASHLSQDLLNRCGVRSLTFNDPALITCMANDYGYRDVFTRPLTTLAQEGDVLVAVSSSGMSDNIVGAVEAALGKGLEVVTLFADPGRHDWPRTRKAWYFFARARDPGASVFVEKSSQHVFQVGQLARHFRNPRFLFMVRNPYAVCEGICRNVRRRFGRDALPRVSGPGRSLEETAAAHVVHCLARQRRNVEAHGPVPELHRGSAPEPRRDPPPSPIGGEPRGVFFTYEAMCAEPERVGQEIRAMVPELDDLDLRRRLPVKGYDEMLTDMNARQIARLGAGQVAAFNRVFGGHRDLFDHFGYELLDAGAFRPEGAPVPRERASPGEKRASPREERVAPGRSG